MGKTIRLFMWGYQPHFRISMELRARAVLQTIAPTVFPTALLIGVRTPEQSDGHAVCVEPEDERWDPSAFLECANRAEQIFTVHPDQNIFYGDAPSNRDRPENIRKKSIRQAVQEAIDAFDRQKGILSFCGVPVRVAGYHVVPILQVSAEAVGEYPQLPEPVRVQDFASPVSFLDSVISCLLDEASRALIEDEPGRFLRTFHVDPDSLLRDAGAHFCRAAELITGDFVLQGVFDALNLIASLPYEGTGAIGRIVFSPADCEAVEPSVRFKRPIALQQHRLARKLVEMSGPNLACTCHTYQGISTLAAINDPLDRRIFEVEFLGHYKWSLRYQNRVLMRVIYGVPQLPTVPLKKTVFQSDVRRIFDGIQDEHLPRLWEIIEAAVKQKHGTLIAISAEAQNEGERLKRQSMPIEPFELTAEMVSRLTSIDGALLVDITGRCHGLGVILDGMADEAGDPSRGARYNSAIRYVKSRTFPTMCVVVSEDGYVDIIPKLRPQVSRGELARQVSLLKTQSKENYHKTRTWLDDHRFYLTAEQCNEVNKEMERICGEPLEVGELRIVTPPFIPDLSMNDSYYIE